MKNLKRGKPVLIGCCLFLWSSTTVFAQSSISAAGGEAAGTGGKVSYSIGQTVYTSYKSDGGSENQGVQQPLEIYWATAVDNNLLDIGISVYPNPTVRSVTLDIPEVAGRDMQYVLTDMQGHELQKRVIRKPETQISFRQLPVGSYLISIQFEAQTVQTFTIIKNN